MGIPQLLPLPLSSMKCVSVIVVLLVLSCLSHSATVFSRDGETLIVTSSDGCQYIINPCSQQFIPNPVTFAFLGEFGNYSLSDPTLIPHDSVLAISRYQTLVNGRLWKTECHVLYQRPLVNTLLTQCAPMCASPTPATSPTSSSSASLSSTSTSTLPATTSTTQSATSTTQPATSSASTTQPATPLGTTTQPATSTQQLKESVEDWGIFNNKSKPSYSI